ncbi:ABC transporter permease [Nitriliruptor alkaliphilus]|uniref:ABC transporter permease n=1 Tax=Nitriliruptor alkaliphilus TaxID=427918 RepID=UPI000B245423|nr:ABC transporter permease [Nitriliruptor alkaliphilus]
MSDVASVAPHRDPGRLRATAQAVGGLLLRDLRVLRRELYAFLSRTIMQPLLFVFVFAYVFPRIGQGIGSSDAAAGGVDFATVLVPGLVAVAIVFQGITAVALPLSNEFGGTKEIEDRIMAPVPVQVVALEKVLFGGLQSVLAGLVVLPMVLAIPAAPVEVSVTSWPLLLAVAVLSASLSGALGLALGTFVNPRQIGLMFSLVVLPLTFLGAVYYPWAALDTVRWLQIGVLVNPLVYISEGLRAALTPSIETMPPAAFLGALALATALLLAIGLRGFVRRTVG